MSKFRNEKGLVKGWIVILADALILGAALIVFALFHHVLPRDMGGPKEILATPAPVPTVMPTPSETPAATVAPTATPEPTPEPTYAVGDFTATFPKDEPVTGLYTYADDDLHIGIERVQEDGITYFVADVWIRDISVMHRALAGDTFGKGIYEHANELAQRKGAILAVNGDQYGARGSGIVVMNGELYRDKEKDSLCVIYQDGTMETYRSGRYDFDEIKEKAVWQAFSFGPELLDENGKAMVDIKSAVWTENPRCAIGYYEPGHYAIVVVDGRQKDYSRGMNMDELSALFEELGCVRAYNLDGGKTVSMVFMGEIINQPVEGGRQLSDLFYFGGVQ